VQAYSPYTGTSWKHEWRESKSGDFPGQFLSIVKSLQQEASNIVNLVEENERQTKIRHDEWEIQQQKWRRKEDEKKQIKNIKDSKTELLSIIEAWVDTKRIDEFFKDAQLRAQDLSENDRQTIELRLMEARELLGTLDALERFKTWKSPMNRE
jgi:vacuolar-type H+-ATPase subunit I/STV1